MIFCKICDVEIFAPFKVCCKKEDCRREYRKIVNADYKKNNVEKSKIYRRRHRQKLKNDPVARRKQNLRNQFLSFKKKNPEFFPNVCIICGTKENIEFHHPCYEFHLSVYPMCRNHHLELHSNEEKIKNVG